MATRAALLDARTRVYEAIRASEEWQPSYKKDRASFAMLVQQEAKLNNAVAEYLRDASLRAPTYVDWSRMPQVTAANDPVDNNGADAWEVEAALLTAAIIAIITGLVTTGTLAGEAMYGIPMSGSLDEAILTYARTHTAQLVTQVTGTTRALIREAVKQSLAVGETTEQATQRLMKVINNPVRAEMIAQTESVNAYQGGLSEFATTTGAKTKTWNVVPGACAFCSPLDGKTITVGAMFTLPNGTKVPHPSGHPRCRCGIIYNY